MAEQATEKFDVLPNAEVGIEIFPKSLRQIRDARAHGPPASAVREITVKHLHPTGLNPAGAGHNGEQGRFADAVRPDQPDPATARNIYGDRIKRTARAIPMREGFNPGDRPGEAGHLPTVLCSLAGHSVLASV